MECLRGIFQRFVKRSCFLVHRTLELAKGDFFYLRLELRSNEPSCGMWSECDFFEPPKQTKVQILSLTAADEPGRLYLLNCLYPWLFDELARSQGLARISANLVHLTRPARGRRGGTC